MTMREHRTGRWRWLVLAVLPFALGGCLAHIPDQSTPESSAVATIPARLFTATVAALPPSAPPAGRFQLGSLALVDPDDPDDTYAVALLQPRTKGLRLTVRVDGLNTPAPPSVSYELVTASGVFQPLAAGEWDRAAAQGGGWAASGTLVFVVPRELRAGQLEIVDYYYPQARPELRATPGPLAPLIRRTLAAFTLDTIP